MAQLSLLEMTQGILSSLDSTEVNSISDTPESLQVANIIKSKYFDIMVRSGLPENNTLFSLDPSNDGSKPVLMFVPDGVSEIKWLKYYDTNPQDSEQVDQFGAFSHDLNTDITSNPIWNTTSTSSVLIGLGPKVFTVPAGLPIVSASAVTAQSGNNYMFGTVTTYAGTTLTINVTSVLGSGTFNAWILTGAITFSPSYKYVTVLPIEQFIQMANSLNIQDTNISSFVFTEGGNNFNFYYRTDRQPKFCTVLSNLYVIFDSFDSTQDTTLQSSKVMCFGSIVPPFLLQDNFVPNIDDDQFPLLFNEAKSLAFFELKQMPHAKAEQEIKRQWSSLQKTKSVSNKPSYFDQLPSFGRMPRTGGYGTIWPKITQSMN